VEPDECYLVGSDQSRQTPDLVIEVVWTSGGIDKLEAYRRLGVPEVWFWKNDRIQIHVLEKERDGAPAHYRATTDSVGLELELLRSALDRPTAMQAVRAFRAALAQPR
jgi:Uma2 family endonuclease